MNTDNGVGRLSAKSSKEKGFIATFRVDENDNTFVKALVVESGGSTTVPASQLGHYQWNPNARKEIAWEAQGKYADGSRFDGSTHRLISLRDPHEKPLLGLKNKILDQELTAFDQTQSDGFMISNEHGGPQDINPLRIFHPKALRNALDGELYTAEGGTSALSNNADAVVAFIRILGDGTDDFFPNKSTSDNFAYMLGGDEVNALEKRIIEMTDWPNQHEHRIVINESDL